MLEDQIQAVTSIVVKPSKSFRYEAISTLPSTILVEGTATVTLNYEEATVRKERENLPNVVLQVQPPSAFR